MRNRTFLRYLISYALVLILPFLSIYMVMDRAMVRRFQEEASSEGEQLLSRVRESLDSDLQQLYNLAYVIQNTSSLNPKNIGEDVISRRNAVALLSTYHSILSLPEFIMIYRSGDAVCYTSTTVITPEKLFGQQLVFDHHDAADFLGAIDAQSSLIVWPRDAASQFGGQKQDYLTLFFSVGAGAVRPRQRTVFVIPARRMEERIRAIAGSDSVVTIRDANGQLLLSAGDLPDGEAPGTAQGETVRLSGRDYTVMKTESGITGWRYTVLRPADMLDGPLRSYRRWIAALAGVMLLLGGILIYVMSWGSYRPIRRLAEKARHYAPAAGEKGEMAQVEAALVSLSDQSTTYRSLLDQSTESLRQIAERLRMKPVSMLQARSLFSDTINVTVQTLVSIRDRLNTELPADRAETQAELESTQELIQHLEEFVGEAYSVVQDVDSRASDQRIETMKQYVRENCLSSDFSLQMAADHFNLTPSNFSHYFKNAAGIGLSEYVQEIRRREACRLLEETDASVQEIGCRVGMPNGSSFIRSFKQQTGLTPGQYRAEHAARKGSYI